MNCLNEARRIFFSDFWGTRFYFVLSYFGGGFKFDVVVVKYCWIKVNKKEENSDGINISTAGFLRLATCIYGVFEPNLRW